MRTLLEFRVDEEFAHLVFEPNEGVRLGSNTRKVTIRSDDPRMARIGELQTELRKTNKRPLYYGWDVKHQYSRSELDSAELFHLMFTAVFEPAGADCGTIYDESNACPRCGAGRAQVSDLTLDLRKVPKTKDIASTIGGSDEWIVTQRLAELMLDAKLTGFELRPVRHKAQYQDDPIDSKKVPSGLELIRRAEAAGIPFASSEYYVWLNRPEQKELCDQSRQEHAELMSRRARRRGKPLPVWYQLVVTSQQVPTAPPTRFGVGPFDDDPKGEYRCPFGHVSGHNLLSEISVPRDAWDGSDVTCTRNKIHFPKGILQCIPESMLLISPRFWRLLKGEKIKGYKVEVAHLV